MARALPLQGRGRRFESVNAHEQKLLLRHGFWSTRGRVRSLGVRPVSVWCPSGVRLSSAAETFQTFHHSLVSVLIEVSIDVENCARAFVSESISDVSRRLPSAISIATWVCRRSCGVQGSPIESLHGRVPMTDLGSALVAVGRLRSGDATDQPAEMSCRSDPSRSCLRRHWAREFRHHSHLPTGHHHHHIGTSDDNVASNDHCRRLGTRRACRDLDGTASRHRGRCKPWPERDNLVAGLGDGSWGGR